MQRVVIPLPPSPFLPTFMLPATRQPILWMVSLLAFVAGAVHLWITPYHYSHAPAHGIFFALVGILQVGWAVAVWRDPAPRVMASGAWFAGGLVVLWGLTELFPIPYDHQHGADGSAYITKAAEVGIFGLSLWLLGRSNHSQRVGARFRLLVLPVVLGAVLYGAAVVQAQAGWLGGESASPQPHSHDGEHSHAEADHSHDAEHSHSADTEHLHEENESIAVATVAVVVALPTRTPVPTTTTDPATPPAEPMTLQTAGTRTYQLTGERETITEAFELPAGLVLFEFNHPADTPFAFFLLDTESNHLTMPANHLHGVAGTGLYRVRQEGVYRLHAIAEDGWEISVMPLDDARLTSAPTPLSVMRGTDSTVALPTALTAGTYEWQWSHAGELAFEIVLLEVGGTERIVALETTGVGDGTATFTVPNDGVYLVSIFADGAWMVDAGF